MSGSWQTEALGCGFLSLLPPQAAPWHPPALALASTLYHSVLMIPSVILLKTLVRVGQRFSLL